MINRVLIRIKVIQLLYSYLLIEKHFMLESQPTPPTTEKRFAYALYLDLLVLMVKIAGNIEQRGGFRPLFATRFISSVNADDTIKALMTKYRVEPFPYQALVGPLSEKIKESAIYRNYVKKVRSDNDSETVWQEIFNIIISPDPDLGAVASTLPNFSLRAVDRVRNMMADTFENFYSSAGNLSDALKQLRISLSKARDLYFILLLLPVELTRLEDRLLDENRHKYITTEQDINPDMRFVDNQLSAHIDANPDVREFVEKTKFSWFNADSHTLHQLLKAIKESDIYADYMQFPATDLATDCEFWRNGFKHIIFDNADFLETLEDKSVFWNDDLEIIGTFLLKTLRRFEEGNPDNAVLPMYKDDEDARFGEELYSDVIKNKDIYRSMIDQALDHTVWERERLAFMDVVVVMTAIAEIIDFPKIPLTVSLNEYIEIAKSYSTPRSGQFVNGLLASVIDNLHAEGRLAKSF